MEDNTILNLYSERSEAALVQTDIKYGRYCYSIAFHILADREDAEECVSDAYLAAWNTIPPCRPGIFSAFLGSITRTISIDRWRARNAYKRCSGETNLVLDELTECIPGRPAIEAAYPHNEAIRAFREFIDALPDMERRVFLRRYWYLDSTQEICDRYGYSESKVKTMLRRLRKRLYAKLAKDGLL